MLQTRVLRIATSMLVSTVMAGCSLFSDPDAQRYRLELIAGEPLPATLTSATTVEGRTYEFQVVSRTLSLFENGRMMTEAFHQDVWDGVPEDDSFSRSRGQYERTDTTITVRFRDAVGVNQTFTYRIVEDGRVLRGIEWEQREARYVRN